LLLFIHGVTRISEGTVGGFGEYLTAHGFPFGFYLAWTLTIFEVTGGVALVVEYFLPTSR
jgi:putative oxidoreductase